MQDGDSNTMIVETVGENNTNEVTQLQFGNYTKVTTVGDNNDQAYFQDGMAQQFHRLITQCPQP